MDIVDRLRRPFPPPIPERKGDLLDAADEIERLRTEVAEKDAALDAAENDIGRPWRFWAKRCREMAQRKEGQK